MVCIPAFPALGRFHCTASGHSHGRFIANSPTNRGHFQRACHSLHKLIGWQGYRYLSPNVLFVPSNLWNTATCQKLFCACAGRVGCPVWAVFRLWTQPLKVTIWLNFLQFRDEWMRSKWKKWKPNHASLARKWYWAPQTAKCSVKQILIDSLCMTKGAVIFYSFREKLFYQ